jgi:hypothetical protein
VGQQDYFCFLTTSQKNILETCVSGIMLQQKQNILDWAMATAMYIGYTMVTQQTVTNNWGKNKHCNRRCSNTPNYLFLYSILNIALTLVIWQHSIS